jgi:hypothetical protein
MKGSNMKQAILVVGATALLVLIGMSGGEPHRDFKPTPFLFNDGYTVQEDFEYKHLLNGR